MGSKEATVILEIEAIINEVNQAKLDPSNSVNDAVQITIPVLSERVANALGYNSEKLNKMSFSRNISNTVRRLGLMKNRRTIGKGITAFDCTSALIKEAKQRYKIETTLSDPSNPSNPSNLTNPSNPSNLTNPSNPSNLTNLNDSNLTPSGSPNNAESSEARVRCDTWVRSKPIETKDDDHTGYFIRVCTQNPGPRNPLKKLRKGMPFRIHKNEISSYNFYDFSKEPGKGEVSEKDEDIHFIETFKAAEIPDRLMRVKQLLLLVLDERPVKSIGTLQRKLSDLEPDLSLADISAAVKELMAMRLVHKSEDGRYLPGKEDVA